MKKIEPSIHLQKKYRHGYWLTILLIILTFCGMAQGKSEFSELVSVDANNEPLSEVLDDVSQASGYEFIIDENWDDLPISVKFDAMPVDEALKRILANVNHAIIYNSDRKLVIRIYEKDSNAYNNSSASAVNRNPRTPELPLQEIERPTSPNPVPPEQSFEEAESDDSEAGDSELSSRQPETPDEENEEKGDDGSSDEVTEAEDRNQ